VKDAPTPSWYYGTEQKHLANTWQTWTLQDPHATAEVQKATLEGWFIDILPDLNQDEGLSVKEAAVEGAVVRLRPIFASSVTTLLGLLPTAYGKFLQDKFGMNGYEPFVSPMALALAWGLMIAMPMTLFLMPTAYVLIEDARSLTARAIAPVARSFGGLIKRIAGATKKEKSC
jgi:hypothetical protein